MSKRTTAARLFALIAAGFVCACAPVLSTQFVQRDFSNNGTRVAPGDVLYVDETLLQLGGIGSSQLVPLHTPWRIPLRHISSGALLPSETTLLQIALEVRRGQTVPQSQGANALQPLTKSTYLFLNRHQVALWDALIDSMIVFPNATGRFGVLKVDYGSFCERLSYAIRTYEQQPVDAAAIAAFGDEVIAIHNCLNRGPGASVVQEEITALEVRSFANYLNNPTSTDDASIVNGQFYDVGPNSHARRAVVVERAAASIHPAGGDERLWSLREWKDSGICTDDAGAPLKIQWIGTETGAISVDTETHNAEIKQSGASRVIVDSRTYLPFDPYQIVFSVVIDERSLAALYPSDVVAIGWGHDGESWTVRPKSVNSCQ